MVTDALEVVVDPAVVVASSVVVESDDAVVLAEKQRDAFEIHLAVSDAADTSSDREQLAVVAAQLLGG